MRLLLPIAAALTSSLAPLYGQVVISQVYGGGGNSGAPFTHDYIELFNRGAAPVSLSGWSLQYASATGTGNLGATATQITELPAVTLNPGQYFLVQQAGSTSGAPLPTADLVDASHATEDRIPVHRRLWRRSSTSSATAMRISLRAPERHPRSVIPWPACVSAPDASTPITIVPTSQP